MPNNSQNNYKISHKCIMKICRRVDKCSVLVLIFQLNQQQKSNGGHSRCNLEIRLQETKKLQQQQHLIDVQLLRPSNGGQCYIYCCKRCKCCKHALHTFLSTPLIFLLLLQTLQNDLRLMPAARLELFALKLAHKNNKNSKNYSK